jgi:hypothetical protein
MIVGRSFGDYIAVAVELIVQGLTTCECSALPM